MNRYVDIDVIEDALAEIRVDVNAELDNFFGDPCTNRCAEQCRTGEFVRVDDLLDLLERLVKEAS